MSVSSNASSSATASQPTPSAPRPLVVGLCFTLLCLIWGSTWIVIKEGLADLPPFTSAAARFSLAALVFSILAPRMAAREGGTRPGLRLVLVMGIFNFGLSYAIVYWSETLLPSGLVSLLWATFPMMMAISGHFFLVGETLRPAQGLGFLIGFGGVAALFLTDLSSMQSGSVGAAAILLVSPLVCCYGNLIVKRDGQGVSSLYLNRDGMAVGALLLSGLAFAFERDATVTITSGAILSVTYLALMGTVVTFGLYFWLMRYARASRMSLIAYVTPPIALSLGAMRGEAVGPSTLIGAGLILLGVVLATRDRAATEGETSAPGDAQFPGESDDAA